LSVFRYVDPVKFLNDAYAFWGLKTPKTFAPYLSGKRAVPARRVPQLAKSLGLAGAERQYFEALLGIHRAKSVKDQEIWMARAQSIYESVALELEAVADLRLLENPVLSALL